MKSEYREATYSPTTPRRHSHSGPPWLFPHPGRRGEEAQYTSANLITMEFYDDQTCCHRFNIKSVWAGLVRHTLIDCGMGVVLPLLENARFRVTSRPLRSTNLLNRGC